MNHPDIQAYLPPLHQKVAVLVLAILGVLWIVRMVRHHRIREEHALVWFAGLAGAVAVIWCDPLLVFVTAALGVKVPASALMLLALFFLFAACVWLTTVVSEQKRQINELVITVSLLKERVERGGPCGVERPAAAAEE
jgi:hypothetical protein